MTLSGYVASVQAATAGREDSAASTFNGRSLNWRQMLERAARIAGGLRALGVQDGDRVAVLAANSDLYMALYLAVPWAGAVLAPLNCRWSVAENLWALQDCTPRVLFVGDELIAANAGLFEDRAEGPILVALDDLPREGWLAFSQLLKHDPIEDAGRSGSDLFAIFYTGGTTGRSKGVMLSHAGFVGNAQATRAPGIARDGCSMLIAAPLFHLAAAMAMTLALLAGGSAVIASGFNPAGALDLIEHEKVTDALMVPTMIQMVLDAPEFDPQLLATLEVILYGASPMPEMTVDRILAAVPHVDFFQVYGMTETSCTVTVLGPGHHKGEHRAAGRHLSAGSAIASVEVMIADEAGLPLPQGEVGEILVRGPGVMLGYWNQPEATSEAVRGGWMHTGDGGRIDDHGLLYIVDRIKDMIVSGGENVYSAEVESAVGLYAKVAQCAVIGVPDPQWGERVHVVIVPRPGTTIEAADITAHCRTLIAGFKCPRSVEIRDALPLSAAGKVLKAELRKHHWKGQNRNVA